MEQDPSQIIFVIILGIILMLLMSGFIVVMVLFHRQRQFQSRQKIDHITAEYDKTVLSVEKEIREQTLVHVGQELHDNIGQLLSLIKLTLRHADEQRVAEAKNLVQETIKEVRSLSKAISLDWVRETDLKGFISTELQKISSLEFCETELHDTVGEILLDENAKLVLIRIIQECLNNAIKHASPSLVYIKLEELEGTIAISIEDDGIGFDVSQSSTGQGVRNLHTRMATIGGSVRITSVSDKGTKIQLCLPNAVN